MGRFIVKLTDNKFIEWSTIVDCPVSSVMSKEEAIEFSYKSKMSLADVGKTQIEEYRRKEAIQAIELADETGMSVPSDRDIEDFLAYNRAGENEKCISDLDELIETYTYSKDKKDKFPWR